MTHTPVPGRSCGKCALCCNMLAIEDLKKPAHEWCRHCSPGRAEGGCTIYEARPDVCRWYSCGWLISEAVAEEWYPLRSRMILTLAPLGDGILTCTVVVDPRLPNRWREEPYYSQLKRMARNGVRSRTAKDILLVQVRSVGRVWLLMDDEDIDISQRCYIAKFVGSGMPATLELFDSQEQAETRVAELTHS